MLDGTYEAPPPGAEGDANFAAYLADVEVDVQTGQVDVRSVVLAIDVGTIINPIAHQGQLDGSLLFGLGAARMEELVVKAAGEVANSAVAPAIANAVADATGARVLELPLRPERVLEAMSKRMAPAVASVSRVG